MALSKLIGRGVGAATRRGAANKGKNRLAADFEDDVVKETKSDFEQMRRALSARADEADDDKAGAALRRVSKQEAGGRALMRTGSRVAAASTVGVGAYEAGRFANEEAEKSKRKYSEPTRVSVASRSMDDEEEDQPVREPAKKEMSFKEAFAAARKDDKATFTWQGKRYTTEVAKEGPKPSVREGRNENIDDDTRKRAVEFSKGGSVPVKYAGMKAPKKPVAAASRIPTSKVKKPAVKTAFARGGSVKGKKK